MIDTHAHLDACIDPAGVVLERARAAGVEQVVTVGTGLASCHEALRLAGSEAGVRAVLGVHPHAAESADAGRLDALRELLADERAIAVGETGLDFFRDYASPAAQQRLFAAHLDLATDLGKPVVVHTRAADEATLALLERFQGTVVLHCFSSPGLLPAALDRGYYVSFAGNVTYPKATELRDAVLRVPRDRLLAETDSPYLAPQAVRGRANEPANVVHTVACLASVLGEDAAELGRRIADNARVAFRLP